MLRTTSRSILVIEDIDYSVELPDRKRPSPDVEEYPKDHKFTLSGLLNFMDGLWSSCEDKRIIIFTTNNKEKLDPALLRLGQMDTHISMSYLTADGFKTLAKNYLNVKDHHWQSKEIEELIESMNVTLVEVAEELMKSDDADVSLTRLVSFLNIKRNELINELDDGEIKDKGVSDEIDGIHRDEKIKLDKNKVELLSYDFHQEWLHELLGRCTILLGKL